MKKIIVLLLMIASESSYAGFISGNKLAENMQEYNKFYSYGASASFSAYGTGVADTIDNLWCSSSSVTVGQIVKVVSKYLENNPEKLHLSASSLIRAALMQAFPCENHSKRSQKR